MGLRSLIKNILPPFFLRHYYASRIRNGKIPGSGWTGDYPSWDAAEKDCEGYDKKEILDKVLASILKVKRGEAAYERDSVTFSEMEYSAYLLTLLSEIASKNGGVLHVADFGGSLGSTYFQYRRLLKDVKELRWAVLEQEHFVKAGNEFIAEEGLRFYADIAEVLKVQKPMVLLLCSVLNYLKNPYERFGQLLDYGFPVVVVDRTGFIESEKERLTKQTVPEFIYKASYPAWFFNESKFIAFANNHHYKLIGDSDSEFAHPRILDDGRRAYWKNFIFEKQATS